MGQCTVAAVFGPVSRGPEAPTAGWRNQLDHKNLIIMGRCKEPLEREFYIRMAYKFGEPRSVTRRGDVGMRRARGRDE